MVRRNKATQDIAGEEDLFDMNEEQPDGAKYLGIIGTSVVKDDDDLVEGPASQ